MAAMFDWLPYTLLSIVVLFLYLWRINNSLAAQPDEVLVFNSTRLTSKQVREHAEQERANPVDITKYLPPRTGNRYIIVGGGLIGGWLVQHLFTRGEDPKRIRILDIRPPTRKDLSRGAAKNVAFVQADITNRDALQRAFDVPWPDSDSSKASLTVFHTAANILFWERAWFLQYRSSRVNVIGTQNVLDVSRKAGAKAFIFTSSGSIALRSPSFWIWPWPFGRAFPGRGLQVIDDSTPNPSTHSEFFSNYAYSKAEGEALVLKANTSEMPTAGLRLGHGVYGRYGDVTFEAYVARRTNPTWIPNIMHSWIYAENASIAHLFCERRLLDADSKVCGQTFLVTDPNPPITYEDVYVALRELDSRVKFLHVPPVMMYLLAQILEAYHLVQARIPALPPLSKDVVPLQPSLFAISSVHTIMRDDRARECLGYKFPWTTLEGMCKLARLYLEEDDSYVEPRGSGGATMAGVGAGVVGKVENILKNVKN